MSDKKFNVGVNLDDSNKVELTAEGKKDLEIKLRDLIDNQRPKIQIELAEARQQGDLSENADYDAAKNKQAEIEAEIARIEDMLTRAKVVKKSSNNDFVSVGNFIKYRKDEELKEVQIVPDVEFDPFADVTKVGSNSPFAKAVLGRKVGEEVQINSQKKYNIKIVSIK